MKREELITKWLDNNLNNEEFEAFKNLEDYEDLIKLNSYLQTFKADSYSVDKALNSTLSAIKSTKKQPKQWLKPLLKIAAILAICFGLYFYTTTLNTTINTAIAEKTEIELPDASSVLLNAKSILAFNKNNWKNERNVTLQGEAFFKVAKGSSFSVITNAGIVTVYGTQFNVKQRENYFEVICYEGLVGVTHNSQETKLKPGDSFLIIDGKKIALEKENASTPSWLNNQSNFKSLPFKTVLAEFERQYNVTFSLINVNKEELFTGTFPHDDIDKALKLITLPSQLTFSKNKNSIILKRE
ncbi:FecR family protein [Postechiella marina]|uniref:FecR family protein n=1 Tax=Postechiella marina TaxID=943941 RepID=A0ABP8C9R8_9FLAO